MSLAVSVARPFAAPPGVREDRVALLRRAFDATMRDPELLGEAQKMNSDIDPMSGAETQSAIARILGTPKEVIAQVQRRWGNGELACGMSMRLDAVDRRLPRGWRNKAIAPYDNGASPGRNSHCAMAGSGLFPEHVRPSPLARVATSPVMRHHLLY